ncbi:unnamed protein product, partial [Rangifer tarandus platyrhynchus]
AIDKEDTFSREPTRKARHPSLSPHSIATNHHLLLAPLLTPGRSPLRGPRRGRKVAIIGLMGDCGVPVGFIPLPLVSREGGKPKPPTPYRCECQQERKPGSCSPAG